MNRRDYLALMGTAAGAIATSSTLNLVSAQEPNPADSGAPTTSTVEDRTRRMKWWHEAKFGMFIHWGLYSTLGRHEWVMENEGIPAKEYEPLADNFKPRPNAPKAWAQLAQRAGMKYMVMTTKHHEGFCNFDSKLTNYCATKRGPGRDLVRAGAGNDVISARDGSRDVIECASGEDRVTVDRRDRVRGCEQVSRR